MGALPLPLHKFVRVRSYNTREKSTKETSEDSWTGELAYRGSRPRCSHVRAPSPSPSPPPRLRVSAEWCGVGRRVRPGNRGSGVVLVSPLAALERGASRLRLGGWGRPMGRPYGPAGTTDYGALGALRSAHTG